MITALAPSLVALQRGRTILCLKSNGSQNAFVVPFRDDVMSFMSQQLKKRE